jgi:adenosine deaminase
MMNLSSLPKIELHCHLDGSIRLSTVAELAQETNVALPGGARSCLIVSEPCADLADYLKRYEFTLALMQRPEHLRRVAHEYVEDLAAEGVIYGETRFAPQLHMREGLSMQQVVDAVSAGLRSGSEATGVRAGLIVCCLRHQSPDVSRAVARLAADNQDKICALDLAGDEARHDAAPHAEAFQIAREAGLRRTVHAGEGGSAKNIRQALDLLGAERIGHGARVTEDWKLVDEVTARAIALEMCPLSNVQTRAVQSLADHPIDMLLRHGVRVTVSTDSRTMSQTTVTAEFQRLSAQFGWQLPQFWRCQLHAAEAAFVPPEVRDELLRSIHSAAAAVA